MVLFKVRDARELAHTEWHKLRKLTLDDHPRHGKSSLRCYVDWVLEAIEENPKWEHWGYFSFISTAEDQNFVGWAAAFCLPEHVQVDVFVHPDHRHHRIGLALAQSALSRAQEHRWAPGVGYSHDGVGELFYRRMGIYAGMPG